MRYLLQSLVVLSLLVSVFLLKFLPDAWTLILFFVALLANVVMFRPYCGEDIFGKM